MQAIIKELTGYFELIQSFEKDMSQDGQACHAYLVELTNILARANFLMAEWNKKFREQKMQAYYKLRISSEAQAKYYAPSLAKDFIDAQCGEVGYVYDLAERLSRLAVHTIDAFRTIISSLKSEREFAQYQR